MSKFTWPIFIFHYSVGPWCFDYPRVYMGRVNVTVGGLPCLHWDSLPPYTFKHLPHQPWGFAGEDIHATENYCRNPDGDIWPWCFTGDPDVPFDFCSIEDLACHPDEKLWNEVTTDAIEKTLFLTGSLKATHSVPLSLLYHLSWLSKATLVLASYACYLYVGGMWWKFSSHSREDTS